MSSDLGKRARSGPTERFKAGQEIAAFVPYKEGENVSFRWLKCVIKSYHDLGTERVLEVADADPEGGSETWFVKPNNVLAITHRSFSKGDEVVALYPLEATDDDDVVWSSLFYDGKIAEEPESRGPGAYYKLMFKQDNGEYEGEEWDIPASAILRPSTRATSNNVLTKEDFEARRAAAKVRKTEDVEGKKSKKEYDDDPSESEGEGDNGGDESEASLGDDSD
jgi:hypothetical protein